jgi:hypothetical protein
MPVGDQRIGGPLRVRIAGQWNLSGAQSDKVDRERNEGAVPRWSRDLL